ncbi:MAG: hypothetical protein ACRDJC_25100 [Thermomicrobiales bacterium]
MPVAYRASVVRHQDKQIALSTTTDVLLVVGAMALALGLAAVSASLAPAAQEPGNPAPDRPRVVMAAAGTPEVRSRVSGDEHFPPSPRLAELADEPGPVPPPHVGAGGRPISPLYPKIGLTLWDRIRVSSRQDERAFLLGAAIQIHTPAIAATPGPQYAFPHPHGVD